MIFWCVEGARCIRRGKPEECFVDVPETHDTNLDQGRATMKIRPVIDAEGPVSWESLLSSDTGLLETAVSEFELCRTVDEKLLQQHSVQNIPLVLYQSVPETQCILLVDYVMEKRIRKLPNKVQSSHPSVLWWSTYSATDNTPRTDFCFTLLGADYAGLGQLWSQHRQPGADVQQFA